MAESAVLLSRLRTAAGGLAGLQPRVLEGEPWPLSADFGHGPEASWGPPEVLAHITEMLPYWLGEAERILAGSPDPVPFGRVATDGVRIAIIGRDRTVPLRDLFDRVEADVERYERRLSAMTLDDLARRGLHPARGEMPLEDVLERFVVGHLEDHVVQLRELLAAREPGPGR